MWWWFRIAHELRLPVAEARRKINSREFLQWQIYLIQKEEEELSKEWKGRSRSDDYAAQIAQQVYELRRMVASVFGGKMEYIPIEKFQIKYLEPEEAEKLKQIERSKLTQEERVKQSKQVWAAVAAMMGQKIPGV